MADGSSKPIEKVQPGDTVKATDEKTGLTEPQQVTATIVGTGDKNLVKLTFVGAGAGGGGPPPRSPPPLVTSSTAPERAGPRPPI